jgi:hypothetical protein
MSMKPALLFAIISLWCLTGPGAESMAQQQAARGTTTVVQLSYYAVNKAKRCVEPLRRAS